MKEFKTQDKKIVSSGNKDGAKPSALHSKQGSPVICCQHCKCRAFFFVSAVNAQGSVSSSAFCLHHGYKEGLMHPRKWELLQSGKELHAGTELLCACGMNQSLLKAKGRVGCARCYSTFAAHFKSILPVLHPGALHAGKTPIKMAPIVNVRRRVRVLEMVMQRAIRREAYEQAAEVRDRIKALRQL